MSFKLKMGLLKLVLLCAAVAAVSSQSAPSNDVNGRVVGGVNARPNEFPHLCSIMLVYPILPAQHVGAANILNRRWVVTVASAVRPAPIFTFYEVACGRNNLAAGFEATQQRVGVNQIIRHQQFAGGSVSANDIALIQLQSELHFTDNVAAITLPVAAAIPTGIGSMIGWGGTDEAWIGQRFGMLQLSRVAILPAVQCNQLLLRWNLANVNTHLCSGPMTGGMSPCNEDLGSSLIQRVGTNNVLIGLVSLPQGCGEPGDAGTYTRVSGFVDWINQNVF